MGYARQFDAEIVNYADDFCVIGKTSAAQMLLAVNRIMTHLELTLNVEKTRCLRCPEQPLEFLGYRIGIDYCHRGTGSYIGTRPSKASVQIIGISVHLIGIRKVELPHSPASEVKVGLYRRQIAMKASRIASAASRPTPSPHPQRLKPPSSMNL